jgi:hypothetical protein
MRLPAKLLVFAATLTVGLAIYKGVSRSGDDHDRKWKKIARVDAPHPADAPHPPDAPHPAAAPHPAEAPEPATAVAAMPADVAIGPDEQIRILTTNRAAFLSLRDDHLVAGLSDSIRQLVSIEMKKKTETRAGVGAMIENAVRSGVEKLLEKEIAVPVSEIRDIDYRGNRIVIRYRHGEPPGVINLESIKSDGNRTLLQQFSEADARRLVEAVRVRIR